LLSSTPGYDYVLTGYSWPDPGHITYSIAPDGVAWGGGANVLNATFNAELGAGGAWQYQIAKALATWESVANINVSPVPDGPFAFNTLGLSQGDPRFGDIRFGGYPFPSGSTALAQTYFPPPDGSTGAGDVQINTAMNFGINTGYDLYSVLLHETGHSLGLNHPQNPAEVMYPVYQGIRTGLAPGDVAGIQAIYGPRMLDPYQQQGQGFNVGDAIDLTAGLSRSSQISVSNLSLVSIGSSEFFSFVAPASTSNALQVTVSAANVSMLSPEVTIDDPSGKVLAQASNPSAWSDSVTAVAQGLQEGQRYWIQVSGATADVFGVGAYAMTVTLMQGAAHVGSPASPTTPPASLLGLPGSVIPPDRFEPNNTPATAAWLGRISQDTVHNLNLASGSEIDYFRFQAASGGVYQVAAPGVVLQAFTSRGKFLKSAAEHVDLPSMRAGTTVLVKVLSATGMPVPTYSLTIGRVISPTTSRKLSRPHRQEAVARAGRTDASPPRSTTSARAAHPAGTRFARRGLAGLPHRGLGAGEPVSVERSGYLKGPLRMW
jgi:hypothetical protein